MDTQEFELSDNELSCEEMDRVSGGVINLLSSFFKVLALAASTSREGEGTGGGTNDPAQMFQQIMQTLTGGR